MPETAAGSLTETAIPEAVRAALANYASDPASADLLFQVASVDAADPLPLLRTLYKFYNRQRRFDLARDYATRALAEAARQAGLQRGYAEWTREHLAKADPLVASQALLALKALAFIALRSGDKADAKPCLEKLTELDPEDGSGVSVVQALAESV